jgi:hypothetical protein
MLTDSSHTFELVSKLIDLGFLLYRAFEGLFAGPVQCAG